MSNKIDVKDNEYVYLNEQYEVCSSNGCCTIGQIEMDLQDDVWVFNTEKCEDKVRYFYQEELEQILHVVSKLNKRDNLGKCNKKVFESPVKFDEDGNVVETDIAKPMPF